MLIPHLTIKKCISSPISIPIVLGIESLCVVATSKYNRIPIKNINSFTIYIQPIRIIENENEFGNSEIVKNSSGHSNKYLNHDSYLSSKRDSLALEIFDMRNVHFFFK